MIKTGDFLAAAAAFLLLVVGSFWGCSLLAAVRAILWLIYGLVALYLLLLWQEYKILSSEL